MTTQHLTRGQLEAAYCWEGDDQVPRSPALTEFRRSVRYHQAQWREAHGYPIGSQPIRPRHGVPERPVGSRLPLAYASETGVNFLTANALDAARTRTAVSEPHQSFDHQRLWADLLSEVSLTFNLFGDLAADVSFADRAVHAWWPDVPGRVSEIRFAHSPGRLDPAYLANLVDWNLAFVLDLGDGTRGIIGVVTAYHNVNRPQAPKPARLARYRVVTEASGVFGPQAMDAVNGTDLIHIWLDHALVFSMLQHPDRTWRWGRLVVVHAAGNTNFADACTRYRGLLVDDSTFSSVTIEDLLDADVLPSTSTAALRQRYLPD